MVEVYGQLQEVVSGTCIIHSTPKTIPIILIWAYIIQITWWAKPLHLLTAYFTCCKQLLITTKIRWAMIITLIQGQAVLQVMSIPHAILFACTYKQLMDLIEC